MKATSKIVSLTLLTAFFVALAVILYPAVVRYRSSRQQLESVNAYEQLTTQLSDSEFESSHEAAENYNKLLSKLSHPLVEADKLTNEYKSVLNLDENGMMGFVSISKIHVTLPIYHGTSDDVLDKACGHLEGSSLPIGGKGTHSVLSAHRSLQTSSLFTNLNKLEVGDVFTVTVLNEAMTYQVDQIKVVLPTETENLKIDKSKDYCTLMTCTPYGINSHRLLVRGVRTDSTEMPKQNIIKAEARMVDKMVVVPFAAMPFVLVLIIYIFFKPIKKF